MPTESSAPDSNANESNSESPSESDQPGRSSHAEPGSFRELWGIAFPLVLSAGSLSLMNFCDRLFLTGYSEDALAASLPAHVLHWTLLAIPLGTAFYANTFVAQYDGAGRTDRVGRALWQAIYLACGAGLLFALLAPLAPAIIDLISDHPAGVQRDEAAYFGALSVGSVPIMLAPVLACFYIGRGKSNVVLFANLASVALNLVLDPLLIFGYLGFPEWGAFGAAVATVLGRTLACGVYVWLILCSDDARPYAVWSHRGLDPALFRRLLRFGLPNGLFWFVDITAFSVVVFTVGELGKDELAATNIAFSVNMLAFIPLMGVGNAVSTLVGRRIGEDQPELAVRSTWTGARIAVAYMGAWAILFLVLPSVVIEPYAQMSESASFGEVESLVVVLLRFVTVYSLFDALAVVFSSAVRGAGDTRFSMLFTFASSWLLLAIPVLVLHHVLGAGLLAIWTACTVYIVFVGTGFLVRFLGGKWKTMKVIEEELPADLVTEEDVADTLPAPMVDEGRSEAGLVPVPAAIED